MVLDPRLIQVAICGLLLGVALHGEALAQSYPTKPIRMIVPFTPAGATDVLARIVGDELGKRLGQPVVIENKPGAGGNIGAQAAVAAPPDGYTLLMAPVSVYAIAMTLYKEPGYDLTRDFAPVSTVANVPHVLVVNPALGVSSLKELLTLARSKPGQLNLASQGVGTVSHLEGEMLRHMAGVDFTHVPYKGSAPALLDLLGGRVQLMFDSVASTLPQIRAGKLTPIAVTAGKRVGVLPAVPTMSEAGLPGYQAESWLGIVVPARTPKPILERLNRELVGLLGQPQTMQALQDKGLEPQGSTPDRFAERIRAELTLWTKLVKTSGATVE